MSIKSRTHDYTLRRALVGASSRTPANLTAAIKTQTI
jgi:hypothetical protein